jgi:hypothetical protein
VLVQALQHRPHCDDLSDDAEQRAADKHKQKAEHDRHPHAGDEQ